MELIFEGILFAGFHCLLSFTFGIRSEMDERSYSSITHNQESFKPTVGDFLFGDSQTRLKKRQNKIDTRERATKKRLLIGYKTPQDGKAQQIQ
jgi:hypothetical protein